LKFYGTLKEMQLVTYSLGVASKKVTFTMCISAQSQRVWCYTLATII